MNSEVKIPKFQFLDSFRGFFAFTVAHSHFVSGIHPWDVLDTMFGTIIGVVGFFILSSFLLTYRLLFEFTLIISKTEKTNYEKIILIINSVIKFAIRRITRIYPLYITVVLAVKYALWFTRNTLTGMPNNLWNTIFIIESTGSIIWTIRVEMTYYLFTPFICIFTSLCSKRFSVLPVVTLIAMCIYCDVHWTSEKCSGGAYCVYFNFLVWFSAFLAGSLILVAIIYFGVENYVHSV